LNVSTTTKIILVCLFVVAIIFSYFASGGGKNLFDNGNAASDLRVQFEQLAEKQRNSQIELDRIGKISGELATRTRRLEENFAGYIIEAARIEKLSGQSIAELDRSNETIKRAAIVLSEVRKSPAK